MTDEFSPAPEPPAGRTRWTRIGLVLLLLMAAVGWVMRADLGSWLWPGGGATEPPPKPPVTSLPSAAPPSYAVRPPVDIEQAQLYTGREEPKKSERERDLEKQVELLTKALQKKDIAPPPPPPSAPAVPAETAEQRRARVKAAEQEREERDRKLKAWKAGWGEIKPTDEDKQVQLQSLKTPYSLPPGWLINCRTEARISNETSGPFRAEVTRAEKDITGQYIVIPQGTWLIGEPSGRNIYGDSRIAVEFKTLTFPNGDYLPLTSATGLDQTGTAGFTDQVDRHLMRIGLAALFTGALRGGSSVLYGYTGGLSERATGGAVQESTAEASRQMQQFMRTDPTITIRPSYGCTFLLREELVLTKAWAANNEPLP